MQTHNRQRYFVLRTRAAIVVIAVVVALTVTAVTTAATMELAAAQCDTTGRESSQQSYDLPDSLLTTVVGTVIEIESHIDRDGGLYLRLDIGEKKPFTIALGSLHTRPPPSKERLKLYETILGLKAGDLVEATVYMLEDGFWLTAIQRVEDDEDC